MDIHSFPQLQALSRCDLCPRECCSDRFSGLLGYCKSDASFNIASICVHKGEEPVIGGEKGICNIFFSHCNLQCIYCQNHQISRNEIYNSKSLLSAENVISQVCNILDTGVNRVGFVSPSHFIPQMEIIMDAVNELGYNPVWIYNSNGYDKVETLRNLEGKINVYLPDLKYLEPDLSLIYSDAPDYPEIAARALKEMYRQKGSALHLDNDNVALSGMIVRHLVLPGHVGNSLKVINFISEELSPKMYISLMSQYFPTSAVRSHPLLKNKISEAEYETVLTELEKAGLLNGWVQDLDSAAHYLPDFDDKDPFELC